MHFPCAEVICEMDTVSFEQSVAMVARLLRQRDIWRLKCSGGMGCLTHAQFRAK